MIMDNINRQSGFTLFEIVITVVVTAILSALVLQAMGTNIQRSAAPLANVRNSLTLQEIMENITADYKRLFIEDAAPMATFQGNIDNGLYTPASDFNAAYEAITFTSDSSGCDATTYPGGCFSEQPCSSNCAVYRVTITQSSTGRSLSALFTQ